MKNLIILLLLLSNVSSLIAQENISNTNKVKRYFYRDSIMSREKWYGDDKKLDSTKTFYKSGELDELFYYNKARYHGKSYKFNRFGEKLTTWEFNKGHLINRTDHKIEFNKKNEEKVKKLFERLKELNQKLKANPNNLKLNYQRASIRRFVSDNLLALNDFKKIEHKILNISKTKVVPEKIVGGMYDHLASIYQSYEMENFTIQYKLKAISASPKESRLFYNLGYYLVRIKSYRLGIAFLDKAIAMVPGHSFANWSLSGAYTDLGDYEKAMICVNIAFKNEASLYKRGSGTAERDLSTTRGLLYHKLGETDKGIADLNEALDINENNSFAYRNLGSVYYDLGEYILACEYLQKAKALGYEKIHDRDDLQAYLELSCEYAAIIEAEANSLTEITLEAKPPEISKLADKPYIYPNPTKGEVNIKNLPFKDYQYLIFDYTGKLVFEGKSQKAPINISKLSTGVYILKVVKGSTSETFRVIKE